MKHEEIAEKMVASSSNPVEKKVKSYDESELELRLKEAELEKRRFDRKIWNLSKEREYYDKMRSIKEEEIEEIEKKMEGGD